MRTGVLLHERCKHLLIGLLTIYTSTSTLELLIYNLYWLDALAIIDIVWRNRRANRVILLGLFSLRLVLFLVGDVVLEIRTLRMPVMVFIVLLCLLLSSHFVSWLLAGIMDRYRLVQRIVGFWITGLVNASCVGVVHFLRSSLDRNQLLVSINDSCLMVWISSKILIDAIVLAGSLRFMFEIKMIHQASFIYWWCHILIAAFGIVTWYLLCIWISGFVIELIM